MMTKYFEAEATQCQIYSSGKLVCRVIRKLLYVVNRNIETGKEPSQSSQLGQLAVSWPR